MVDGADIAPVEVVQAVLAGDLIGLLRLGGSRPGGGGKNAWTTTGLYHLVRRVSRRSLIAARDGPCSVFHDDGNTAKHYGKKFSVRRAKKISGRRLQCSESGFQPGTDRCGGDSRKGGGHRIQLPSVREAHRPQSPRQGFRERGPRGLHGGLWQFLPFFGSQSSQRCFEIAEHGSAELLHRDAPLFGAGEDRRRNGPVGRRRKSPIWVAGGSKTSTPICSPKLFSRRPAVPPDVLHVRQCPRGELYHRQTYISFRFCFDNSCDCVSTAATERRGGVSYFPPGVGSYLDHA